MNEDLNFRITDEEYWFGLSEFNYVGFYNHVVFWKKSKDSKRVRYLDWVLEDGTLVTIGLYNWMLA